MKTLICGLTVSLGLMANSATAQQMINIDGKDYPLSDLMATCQQITDDASKQVACFNDLAKLMAEQSGGTQKAQVSVPDALAALQEIAQYQDDDSGLVIAGTDCNIEVTYYGNYYHLSRRNISTLDLFTAKFDASKFQYDQLSQGQSGAASLAKGVLEAGATASTRGGVELDSAKLKFAPKSPRATLDAYASEVVAQLPEKANETFEFVLVHPKNQDASADIWGAFETFVGACKG